MVMTLAALGSEVARKEWRYVRQQGVPRRTLRDTTKIHKGGLYHDGRFTTLQHVVNHYDTFMKLGLTTAETRDLIEYLKSL